MTSARISYEISDTVGVNGIKTKNRSFYLYIIEGRFLLCGNFYFRNFAFCFDAASTSLYAITIIVASPLQVRFQALDGGSHAVRTLNGFRVSLAANGTHSWHWFIRI